MGKMWSKANRFRGFANDLDKFVRNSQDGQTLGLPIGPDTSFLISEMIAAAIDEEIQKLGWRGFRFVDDFEFCFLSRSEAEQALPQLENILSYFELALNNLKTSIDDLPVSLENTWRISIKGFVFPDFPNTGLLTEYFNLLFELYRENKTQPILRYGIARLRSVQFKESHVLVDLIFQCIVIEPGALKEALVLFERKGIIVDAAKMQHLIRTLIDIHGPMKHGTEVAWALWAALRYEINLPPQTISRLDNFDDCAVALLALHAYQEGLAPREVLDVWRHLMTPDSLTDGHWLLAYEADLKRWLPSQTVANHVDGDPLFSVLKQNNVSFYDDSIAVTDVDDTDEYGVDDADEEEDDEDEDHRAFD